MIISPTKVHPRYFESEYKFVYMVHNNLVYSLCTDCDFGRLLLSLHSFKTFNSNMKEIRELNDY